MPLVPKRYTHQSPPSTAPTIYRHRQVGPYQRHLLMDPHVIGHTKPLRGMNIITVCIGAPGQYYQAANPSNQSKRPMLGAVSQPLPSVW
jgi:hypothetical protein